MSIERYPRGHRRPRPHDNQGLINGCPCGQDYQWSDNAETIVLNGSTLFAIRGWHCPGAERLLEVEARGAS